MELIKVDQDQYLIRKEVKITAITQFVTMNVCRLELSSSTTTATTGQRQTTGRRMGTSARAVVGVCYLLGPYECDNTDEMETSWRWVAYSTFDLHKNVNKFYTRFLKTSSSLWMEWTVRHPHL